MNKKNPSLPILASILLVGIGGCSTITNTLSGMTTPQSTISGSNYVYVIDPDNNKVVRANSSALAGENINPGDHFSILLDFGFIRYLQAVDPYLIVYSEAWMGDEPVPTKAEDKLRQVVLIKDGLAQNALLPITNYPILGPVTLGSSELPVSVSLKIVVLSKKDNQEAISLIEQISAAAGAAAPQYKLMAEAAGAVGSALVSLNRDKIEFEHTMTFQPSARVVGTGYASEGQINDLSNHILKTGEYVIFKGESPDRRIPFETWYYYLWPFEWFGHSTDKDAMAFEAKTPLPTGYKFPAWNSTFESTIATITWPLRLIIHTPVWLASGIFVPEKWEDHKYRDASKSLTELSVDGKLLKDNDKTYSDKTYMAISIVRTDGSYGTFDQLKGKNGKFAQQAQEVDNLLTTPTQAATQSTEKIKMAFDTIKKLAVYDHSKKVSDAQIKKGEYQHERQLHYRKGRRWKKIY